MMFKAKERLHWLLQPVISVLCGGAKTAVKGRAEQKAAEAQVLTHYKV